MEAPVPATAPQQGDTLASVAHFRALKRDARADRFEAARDELFALPASATPALISAARREMEHDGEDDVLDLLVQALADRGSPEAWPTLAATLRHRAPNVRFAAACGLDKAAGKRFKVVEQCIRRDCVDHSAVLACIPGLEEWWRSEGQVAMQAAKETHTLPRVVSRRERRWNFVASSPAWVMTADGTVYRPTPGSRLPAGTGVHVVSGTVRLPGQSAAQRASIELDARTGKVVAAFVRGPDGWERVPPGSQVAPRFDVDT